MRYVVGKKNFRFSAWTAVTHGEFEIEKIFIFVFLTVAVVFLFGTSNNFIGPYFWHSSMLFLRVLCGFMLKPMRFMYVSACICCLNSIYIGSGVCSCVICFCLYLYLLRFAGTMLYVLNVFYAQMYASTMPTLYLVWVLNFIYSVVVVVVVSLYIYLLLSFFWSTSRIKWPFCDVDALYVCGVVFKIFGLSLKIKWP